MPEDTSPFSLNVKGVTDLVQNKTNKVVAGSGQSPEGASSEKRDVLDLDMTDEELLKLRDQYEKDYAPYEGKLKPRVAKIRESYQGKRPQGQYLVDTEVPLAANLQFEAMETFLAAALAKNPDPVVYTDNTPEGNAVATAVKTMLQYHADQLVIRRKLTLLVRQWAMNLLGGLKPGWNAKLEDVLIENTKIQDYVFDPEGYVDAYGDFSSWFGERKEVTAEKLIELFPEHETYIKQQTDSRLGTKVIYTEWWVNDDYCFYTFKDKVLDKHKNHLFNYAEAMTEADGSEAKDPISGETMMTTPRNHFAHPKKPGIFLSVYSLQEHPHDITSLVEQNIPNQNLITRRTEQIDFNVSTANNAWAFSEDNFNQETGKQAANARKRGNPILVPSGGPIANAILPLNAQSLPADVFNQLEISKNDLRTSWGVQGITAQPADEDQTARGMILNQSHDSSRIGGGIGDSIEQVADNLFNWLVQLYYVFYDEKHFAAIMGGSKSVEYVTLSSQDLDRQLIVSVSPDSMKPKDEISQMNQAMELFTAGAIGPKTLLTQLNFADPDESAADGVLWQIDPMSYFKLNFPEEAQKLQQAQQEQMQMQQQAQQLEMQQGAQAADQQLQQKGAMGDQALQQKEQAHGQKMQHTEEAFKQKQAQKDITQPAASSSLKNVPLPKK